MAEQTVAVDLEYSPIPDGCVRLLQEVTIRNDGHVWRIHKTDPDPFPSKPHAHNIESGLKLDLSSGRLYLGGRDTGKALDPKHLADIRRRAEQAGVELPALNT